MIYLATPHSHPSPFVREQRYLLAAEYTAFRLLKGDFIYSPIVHTHQLSLWANFPADFAFFERYDFDMLQRCDQLCVLMIDGWDKSRGVRAEIAFAQVHHIPVVYETARPLGAWLNETVKP